MVQESSPVTLAAEGKGCGCSVVSADLGKKDERGKSVVVPASFTVCEPKFIEECALHSVILAVTSHEHAPVTPVLLHVCFCHSMNVVYVRT